MSLSGKRTCAISSVQSLSRVRICNPMNCSMPGLLVHHQLLEFTQTHVHWVSDAIQPSHPGSAPSPPAPSLSQHQALFKWVSSSHQVAKLSEFQLQHLGFIIWPAQCSAADTIDWIYIDPMDCSPPGSSVHGVLRARVLEWVAMPSSRGSSQPRSPTLQVYSLLSETPGEPILTKLIFSAEWLTLCIYKEWREIKRGKSRRVGDEGLSAVCFGICFGAEFPFTGGVSSN